MNINPAALKALLSGDIHNAVAASLPGGIEAQEAAGQAAMVATSRLPRRGLNRTILEHLGFVIGGNVDELFVAATLPTGWELKPTSHSMHTDIVDDKGRKRGSIFYKAAFYDERAEMHLLSRYYINSNFSCDDAGNACDYNEAAFQAICICDHTQDTPIHYIAINADDAPRDKEYYNMRDTQEVEAKVWLDANFPDHKNVIAYW